MNLSMRKNKRGHLFINSRFGDRKKWPILFISSFLLILFLSANGCFVQEQNAPSQERKGSGTKIILPQENQSGKAATDAAHPPETPAK